MDSVYNKPELQLNQGEFLKFKTIQPLKRRLADEVYQQLINAIMSREITHKDFLVQERLAAELQISRTPVREALMRLEQEGVLEISNRGSYQLYKMEENEVRELYQARAAIEGQAARILASKKDPKIINDLSSVVAKEENMTAKTARAYFEANRKIHRKFVELTKNRYLVDMFDTIWGKAMVFPLFATIEHIDLAKSLGDHSNLVEVIAAGNKTKALEVFTKHIQDGFDLQLRGLKKAED